MLSSTTKSSVLLIRRGILVAGRRPRRLLLQVKKGCGGTCACTSSYLMRSYSARPIQEEDYYEQHHCDYNNHDGDDNDNNDDGDEKKKKNDHSRQQLQGTARSSSSSAISPPVQQQAQSQHQQSQQQQQVQLHQPLSSSSSLYRTTSSSSIPQVELEKKAEEQKSPRYHQENDEGGGEEEEEDDNSSSHSPPPQPPTSLTYTGNVTIPITTRLRIIKPGGEDDTPGGIWPVFRLMDEDGRFRDPAYDDDDDDNNADPSSTSSSTTNNGNAADDTDDADDLDTLRSKLQAMYPYHAQEFELNGLLRSAKYEYADTLSRNTLLRAYTQMLRLKEMDTILQNAQRQGRISFYMTCRGEEAIHMGTGSSLEIGDPIFAQYREQGLLMWRGFTLDQFTNQCFSNDLDLGKGRQMPVHYGSRALNYHTVSSPLGTQLPQAVGAAYKLKLDSKPNVVACYFGDGCASTTDFHAALNFAATLEAPVLFICRNNGYAISTPVSDQYAGDGIISRAAGYGMAGIRVDGNDVFALHAAIRECKSYAIANSKPVLIECMTYRQGHHSTSDDSTRYRSIDEVRQFKKLHDPITRLKNFIRHHTNWLNNDDNGSMEDGNTTTATSTKRIVQEQRAAILRAIDNAEHRPTPPLDQMFEDVYETMPPHLQKQQAELNAHINKYPKKYG